MFKNWPVHWIKQDTEKSVSCPFSLQGVFPVAQHEPPHFRHKMAVKFMVIHCDTGGLESRKLLPHLDLWKYRKICGDIWNRRKTPIPNFIFDSSPSFFEKKFMYMPRNQPFYELFSIINFLLGDWLTFFTHCPSGNESCLQLLLNCSNVQSHSALELFLSAIFAHILFGAYRTI